MFETIAVYDVKGQTYKRGKLSMKDHSTMNTVEFLVSIGWKFLIGFIWYKSLLFRILPRRDAKASLHIFLGMVLLSLVVCLLLFIRRWKTGWVTTACIALPFGAYTVKAYAATFAQCIRVVLAVVALLVLVCSVLLLARKIRSEKPGVRRRVCRDRISRCIYSTTCIATLGMLALMGFIGGKAYFGTALVSASVEAESNAVQGEDTLDANIDMVLKLKTDTWQGLTASQKIDVLQTVANIEVYYLGLNDAIVVQGDNLSQDTLGEYSDSQRSICIDLNHLENDPVEDVLDTLLHEVYHSYEHRLVDVYNSVSSEYRNLRLFRYATQYADEFGNYIDPSESYYDYISQRVEIDSDTYAELGVKEYYTRIEKYLNAHEGGDAEASSTG
jgi:hypothetical protein